MYKFCLYCGGKLLKNNVTLYQCKRCNRSLYIYSKPTVTIIPIYKEEMMIGIRATEPKKGKLDFIGGFLNNGEDPFDGGIREFAEETGLKMRKINLNFLGIWIDDYEFDGQNYKTFNVVYYVILKEKVVGEAADDLSSLRWLPINGVYDFAFQSQTDILKKLREGLVL